MGVPGTSQESFSETITWIVSSVWQSTGTTRRLSQVQILYDLLGGDQWGLCYGSLLDRSRCNGPPKQVSVLAV